MFKSKYFSFDDSVLEIEKGINMNSNSEVGYQALYEIYQDNRSNSIKCIDILTNLIRISPSNDKYYYERSKWWSYPFQLKNSILDLEKAISINSEDYEYFESYASCLFDYKDFKGAINALQKWLENRSGYTHLNLNIAKNYFYLLDFVNTINFMKKETTDYWDVEYFYIYGYSLFRLDRFEESIYYYTKGIEKLGAHDNDFVLFSLLFSGRGNSYKKLGDISKSTSDFNCSQWACDMYFDHNPSERIEKRFPPDLRRFE